MVSMQIEDSDSECYPIDSKYGYGLSLRLTEEQVSALGLASNPPKAGSTVGIQAIAIVQEVTSRADADADKPEIEVSLCLQITDMEINQARNVDAASILYS